jgi:hypothetical protein
VTGQTDPGAAAAPDQNFSQNFSELKSAAVAINQLNENVRDGKVTLDPQTGADLLAALREHGQDVTDWQSRVGELAQPLPLGNNPVANAMGEKFSGRATGQNMALSSVLSTYHDAITDATNAIDEAMQRYADNEQTFSQSFRRLSTPD